MRSRILVVAAVVAVLGFAPAPLPKKDRHREGPADLTGFWEIVRWETSGTRWRHREEAIRVEITEEHFVFVERDGGLQTEYVMRLEPTLSPPAFTWGRTSGQATFVGSYRLQKNELTMILEMSNRLQDRPTDFAGKPRLKLVLRRGSSA